MPNESQRPVEAPDELKYWAFISYSHADESFARWLHRRLENYAVPQRLHGRKTHRGTVPKHLRPIFRDRDELPTSADLGANIEAALAASRYLIVVCSPHSAASHWVNEEVLAFKRLGRAGRILAVIVDGEPNVSLPGALSPLECFCPALRLALGADGALTSAPIEPMAADARTGKDGRERALLKLVAGILGVDFDELLRRHRRQRRRRLLQAAAAVLALVAVGGGYALWTEGRRVIEATERKRQEVLALTAQARRLFEQTRIDDALRLAVEALPSHYDARQSPEPELLHLLAAVRLQSPLVAVLNHEDEQLDYAALAPGGDVAVTSSAHRVDTSYHVQLWDVAAGARRLELTGLKATTWTVGFSPDRESLYTVDSDYRVRFWSAETGRALFEVPVGFSRTIAFDGAGKRFLVENAIYDARTGAKLLDLKGHRHNVTSGAFDPARDRVATVSMDRSGRVWDAATGATLFELNGHTDSVVSVAFDTAGARILTASEDGTARIWAATDGRELRIFQAGAKLRSAAFSRDGGRILTLDWKNTATLWNSSSGARVAALDKSANGAALEVLSAVFSPDGRIVATGSADGLVRLWRSDNGALIREIPAHRADAIKGSERAIQVGFDATGRYLISGSFDGTARVWDLQAEVRATTVPGIDYTGTGAVVAPTGATLTTFIALDTLSVWNIPAGRESARLRGGGREFTWVAYDRSGERILTGTSDGRLQIWSAANGDLLRTLEGHSAGIINGGFDRSGQQVFSVGSDNRIGLWDIASGERRAWLTAPTERAHPPPGQMSPLAAVLAVHTEQFHLRPVVDATLLRVVVRGEKSNVAELRDIADGTLRAKLEGHRVPLISAAFSPSGDRIATTSGDGRVRLWDGAGRLLFELRGHADGVLNAAFNAAGDRLVTMGYDGTARVWNVATGRTIAPFERHRGYVHGAAFDAAGLLIATAAAEGRVRIWDARTGLELIALDTGAKHALGAVFLAGPGLKVVTFAVDKTQIWDIPVAPAADTVAWARRIVRQLDATR